MKKVVEELHVWRCHSILTKMWYTELRRIYFPFLIFFTDLQHLCLDLPCSSLPGREYFNTFSIVYSCATLSAFKGNTQCPSSWGGWTLSFFFCCTYIGPGIAVCWEIYARCDGHLAISVKAKDHQLLHVKMSVSSYWKHSCETNSLQPAMIVKLQMTLASTKTNVCFNLYNKLSRYNPNWLNILVIKY